MSFRREFQVTYDDRFEWGLIHHHQINLELIESALENIITNQEKFL